MMLIKNMERLVKKLNEATEAYDRGAPIMTDQEWDELYFKLKKMEESLDFTLPHSPTQTIAYTVVNELKKVKHNHDMLSLAKTKELIDVEKMIGDKEVLAMLKLDGLTCSLKYADGKLVSAETRGDGKIGEDILHNAFVIESIPKLIDYKDELIVDGEIICTEDDFKPFSKDYKNSRNFAAGSIRLLDSKECEKRNLTFVVWDIIKGFEGNELDDKLFQAYQEGFTIVPGIIVDNNSDLSLETDMLKDKANLIGYPIDGIVFKFNDIKYGKTLGATAHHFNNAIAYKFYDETYLTSVKYIEWTMGRTGVLTPVAVLEPIDIDGTTVERASLHNVSIFKEMKLRYQGQEVEVFKANQIIPQIAKVHEYEYENASVCGMEIPNVCPVCGGVAEVQLSDGGIENLMCINPQCKGKLINRLDHFCSKKGLDIKGLSKATLEKLIDWGYVNDLDDLFNLENVRDAWIKKPGFGEKSVNKIINSIYTASQNVTLEAVISSIGIPLIGRTVSKDLANRFKTYENFRKHIDDGFDFTLIDGYGPEMNKALLTFNYGELDFLVGSYMKFAEVEESATENTSALEGKVIVITGKLTHYKNRDALKAEIEKHGGKVASAISSKTDYLINNDVNSTSAKNKKAAELGIQIISEEKFIKFFK